MPKYLIVNADDYGLTRGVSAGIRHAHCHGLVTSTTVMANRPEAEADVERALAECPELGLGVHLVLTAGRPVLPPAALPRLTGLSGGAHFPRLADVAGAPERLDPAEVQAEWQAQIERFVAWTGRAPTHLDSHHHTSYLAPALLDAMFALAHEWRCAVRLPLTRPAGGPAALSLPPSSRLIENGSGVLHAVLAAWPHVPRPDFFEARFYGAQATPELLADLIGSLPDGVTELMCHPGHPDDALRAVSSYQHWRGQELAALTAPGARRQVEAGGARLIHFGQLGSGG